MGSAQCADCKAATLFRLGFCVVDAHLDCSVGSGAGSEASNAVGEHGVGREANQTLRQAARVSIISTVLADMRKQCVCV